MPELQIRLPYDAWEGEDGWQDGSDDLLGDLDEALDDADAGDTDDPDHFNECICFYLEGPDVDEMVAVATRVLTEHGLLHVATAMVTDPDAGDVDTGTPVALGGRDA